jgi:Raf kinase inhibitor-like YbhB/YbcL family protein
LEFKICSSAFPNGGYLPGWYSSQGLNASPPFGWACEPGETRSLVIICRSSENKVHWLLWNIPPQRKTVYGRLPRDGRLSDGMCQGVNDFLETGWTGPLEKRDGFQLCFDLHALDCMLDITPESTDAKALEAAMKGHVLKSVQTSCIYS